MTNQFVNSLSNVTYTENNMVTNRSTLNPHLDLFYRVGNRSKDASIKTDVVSLFVSAAKQNLDLAVKIMGWSRSVRNGAGVREHLRAILKSKIFDTGRINWEWFVKEGYWKDIFALGVDYFNADDIVPLIDRKLREEDNLLLKYLPRQKKNKKHPNNEWIKFLRDCFEWTPKEYRKVCSSFVTPETLMCKRQWGAIEYSKVPSICMHRNIKSFYKHDGFRIKQFIEEVKAGKKDDTGKAVKMNVNTLYPHQIIMPFTKKSAYHPMSVSEDIKNIAQAQWSQLDTKFKSNKKIFVVADTSGSMEGEPICISKALAIYMAERLTGSFHNFYSIFSQRPAFFKFKDEDSIYDKVNAMSNEDAMNTNIEALFSMILHKAVTESIPKEDMPEIIMIISDMQFDRATNENFSIQDLVKDQYAKAGYEVPVLVFWNVRNSYGIPVKANDEKVILFSGASPNSISQAISGEIDPYQAMLRIVNKDEFYWLIK